MWENKLKEIKNRAIHFTIMAVLLLLCAVEAYALNNPIEVAGSKAIFSALYFLFSYWNWKEFYDTKKFLNSQLNKTNYIRFSSKKSN